jgi:hypothetical protein
MRNKEYVNLEQSSKPSTYLYHRYSQRRQVCKGRNYTGRRCSILCHGNNDQAKANELSASHIAAQSPSDDCTAMTNMARAFGDRNATPSDGSVSARAGLSVKPRFRGIGLLSEGTGVVGIPHYDHGPFLHGVAAIARSRYRKHSAGRRSPVMAR